MRLCDDVRNTGPIADDLNLYLKGRLVADRTLEPVGTMTVSEAGRNFEITAESEAFADLRDTVSGLLNQAADNLERRAATARERAGNLPGEALRVIKRFYG